MKNARLIVAALTLVGALSLTGCPSTGAPSDGLDVATLPAGVRADYEIFAQRCSKCHALGRALDSGITDDVFWKEYVARMRRQTASGISPADEPPILRFLHYYSLEQKRVRAGDGG